MAQPDQIEGNHGNTVFVVQNCVSVRMKALHCREKE